MAKVPPTLENTPAAPPQPAGGVQLLEESVEVAAPVEHIYRPRGFGIDDVPGGKRLNFLITPYEIVGIELVDAAIDGLIAQLRPEPTSALWTPEAPAVVLP